MKKTLATILIICLLLATGGAFANEDYSPNEAFEQGYLDGMLRIAQNEIYVEALLARYIYRGVQLYDIELTIDPWVMAGEDGRKTLALANAMIIGGADGYVDYAAISIDANSLTGDKRISALCLINCIEFSPIEFSVYEATHVCTEAEKILQEITDKGIYSGHGFTYELNNNMFFITKSE